MLGTLGCETLNHREGLAGQSSQLRAEGGWTALDGESREKWRCVVRAAHGGRAGEDKKRRGWEKRPARNARGGDG